LKIYYVLLQYIYTQSDVETFERIFILNISYNLSKYKHTKNYDIKIKVYTMTYENRRKWIWWT